jgi:Tfp pilus assembly protein PilN
MRPVNLIPPEQRRGDRAPTRTGPISYLVVGALALALAGVTAVVLTSNQIADRKDEIASLEVREAAAMEKVASLASYAEFAELEQARAVTVDSLARSRFDWERVLRELALVIPSDIELTGVNGSVAPGVAAEGGAEANTLRAGAPGPALEVSGCSHDQEDVAEFAAALEDIDGVTRVGVNTSEREAESAGAAGGGSGAGCEEVPGIYTFQVLAAFDEVAVAAPAGGSTAAPTAPAPAAAESSTATDPSVAGAQETQAQAETSAQGQTDESREAANLIPGAAR